MNAKEILQKAADFIQALISNGGPSVVRFVFWATASTVGISWFGLCLACVWGYFKFGHADSVLCTMIAALAVTMCGFASYAANTKTITDAQAASGNPSKADIGIVGSTIASEKKE